MTVTDHDPSLSTRDGLLAELAEIESEGWNGERGRRLLAYVLNHVVRTQVIASGLAGPAAAQAEATGWEVAWEILNRPRVRELDSPWGWVWVAVRRAIQGEVLSAVYLAGEREAWRTRQYRRDSGTEIDTPTISLERLMDLGWERSAGSPVRLQLGERLMHVVRALVRAGWEPRVAHAVVEAVSATATRRTTTTAGIQGWRSIADDLSLPPWQVRRVAVLLLGGPEWPGVVHLMRKSGAQVLADPIVVAAVKSTSSYHLPPPLLAARRATCEAAHDMTNVA